MIHEGLALAFAALAVSAPVEASESPSVIVVGGGWGPAGNQVSIEHQTRALIEALRGRSPIVLFGGVSTNRAVQESDDTATSDRVLGLVFDRRDNLQVRYRPSKLSAPAADRAAILDAIRRTAPAEAGTILFGVGHGAPADEEHEATLQVWGPSRDALSVSDLAGALSVPKRRGPVALVLGHCFSGAFTDLIYQAATPGSELASPTRCVFAAVPRDREAAGCTADLNDASARAYMLLIAQALNRQKATADLDGDKSVSLAEAHAFARIEDRTVNLPVSSSLAFVMHILGDKPLAKGRIDKLIARARPEERAVLRALMPDQIEPSSSMKSVLSRRAAMEAEAQTQDKKLAQLETKLAQAVDTVRAAVLDRWPELSNPYHHVSRGLLAGDAAEVVQLIERHPSYRDARSADTEAAAVAGRLLDLDRALARLDRWLAAAERTAREGRIKRPQDRRAYDQLLACEAMTP